VKNRRIGLIGNDDDPEVELLKQRIEDLGAQAVVLDFTQFPRFTLASLSDIRIRYDDIDLASLDAFYLRQLSYFSPFPQKQLTEEEWADYFEKFNTYITNEREVMSFSESVVQILNELKPVVNPYETAFYHKLKVFQYWKLAGCGLEVPEFIAANDVFAMREFVKRFPAVAKPLTGGFVTRFPEAALEAAREDLRKRPVLVQREITGRMLRSFVLAGRLIGTCETISAPGEADSRRDVVAMKPYDLEPRQRDVPVRACQALGMIFAGVDLLVDEASGKVYVLECNPAPFFRNFEAQTGLPVSQALARYLVEEARK